MANNSPSVSGKHLSELCGRDHGRFNVGMQSRGSHHCLHTASLAPNAETLISQHALWGELLICVSSSRASRLVNCASLAELPAQIQRHNLATSWKTYVYKRTTNRGSSHPLGIKIHLPGGRQICRLQQTQPRPLMHLKD